MAFARYVQQMVETLGAEGTLSFVQTQIASMAQPEPKPEPEDFGSMPNPTFGEQFN
jgi:hypothetical protein